MVADLFHFGHVRFLKQARDLGDTLTVGLLSDEWVVANKRPAVMNQAERREVIAGCRHVDEVILKNRPANGQWMQVQGFVYYVVAFGTDEDRHRQEQYSDDIMRQLRYEVSYEHEISTSLIIRRILDAPY